MLLLNTELKKLIKEKIHLAYDEACAVRRYIHQHPEISGEEFKTASFIESKLKQIGLHAKRYLDKTAVVATLHNGKGPLVVLRADTDALPIIEETGLAFASVNKGVMHACGHDMHMACLIGAARVLFALKAYWKGTIVFLFQPQEEMETSGAAALIECGAFPEKADAVFGLHVNPEHETGTVGVKKGIDYAGVQAFDITIKGKGGHGGTPEKTIDPVVCASHIVTELQTIISREKSPFAPAVLTVGSFQAGTRRNIIPETAALLGTIRCHSLDFFNFIKERITAHVTNTAQAYRCHATVTFDEPYPPVVNDIQLSDRFVHAFSSFTNSTSCIMRPEPTMYAEDFSFYQLKTPGVYIHLGVTPKKVKNAPSLHSPYFSPDEKAILTGIAAHTVFSLEVLSVN